MGRVPSRALERWVLAAGFAVAAAYAIVALIEAVAGHNPAVAIPFAYVALSIAGPLAAVSRLLRSEPPGPGGDGDGRDPSDDGDEPNPPSWWPDFEREFWAEVDVRDGSGRAPDRSSALV
jgi:hypothetical protein